MSDLPTLDELLNRLIKSRGSRESDSLVEVYRRVASGERHPTKPPLPNNVVVLAAQAMVVLFNHVEEPSS